MSSYCQSEHSPVIDASTATIVCQSCSRVLHEGLAYEEVKPHQSSYVPRVEKDEMNDEKINGENAFELLEKIADKLHISPTSVNNAYTEYQKNVQKIAALSSSKKKLVHSYENILVFSIYVTLKKDSCPRSIKELCYFSGGLKPLNVLQVGTFLEKSRNKRTPPQRLKPVTAKDIILTHYPYIEGLTFDDNKQIFHRLNCIEPVNFTPVTTAASLVYMYTNFVIGNKQTLQQISSLFHVTPVSIQRFLNKYKKIF